MVADRDAIRKLNDALTDVLGEMPRPPGKEDWVYRDLPQVREDFFEQFLEMVGPENIEWITFATYQHKDGLFKRGQFWLSPAGLERLKNRPKPAPDASTAGPAGSPTQALDEPEIPSGKEGV